MTHKVTLIEEREIARQFPRNIVDNEKDYFISGLKGLSWEVYLKEFHNIRVNNEVFLKQGFKILPESFGDYWQNAVFNRPSYLIKSFVKDQLRRKVKFQEVLWCFDTFSTGGYFHWITEIAPRLWIASKHIDATVPLLIPSYFLSKWKFGADILNPFGRRVISFTESERPYCRTMHFVSPPGGPFNYQPEPIHESSKLLRDFYYRHDFEQKFPLKIYISRKKVGKRQVLNEDAILPVLKKFGYMVMYLEDLTIADQINMFSRATAVVSIHGAGLANMVFMPPGSKVIEIRHKEKNHMLNFFFSLASTYEHNYYYCFGYRNEGYTSPAENRPEDASIDVDIKMLTGIL